ncbi:MAG: STAS domain-containing protein [Mariprofundaceae bacterium]|nr:STAS domain-containing protein [Mariprofundaceae bacterium]
MIDVQVLILKEKICIVTPDITYLDAFYAPSFREAVVPQVNGYCYLVLDCSHVQYVDSTGLASLIHVFKALSAGGCMALVSMNKNFTTLLEQAMLNQLFPCFDTVDAAVAAWDVS